MRFLAAIASLLLAAAAAHAETLVLQDGSRVSGKILEVTDTGLTLELADLPGTKYGVRYEQLTDYSAFEFKSRRAPDTVEGHEALAAFCVERKMFHLAIAELRKAQKLAPARQAELEERIEGLQDTCGKTAFAKGQSLVDAGRLGEALKYFREVSAKYPGCQLDAAAKDAAKQVEGLLADKKRQDALAKMRATEEAENAAKANAEAALRQRVFGLLQKGEEELRAGLAASRSLAKQEDILESAQAKLEKAKKLAQQLPPSARAAGPVDGETVVVSRDQVLEEVSDRLIDVYVALGFNALERGAFEKAADFAGMALSIDPNSDRANELRSSIATARASIGR